MLHTDRLDPFEVAFDNGPIGCLKREGTLILVGAPPQPLELSSFGLIFGRRKVIGSLVGGIPETQEMLDHCGKHNITSDIEMTTPAKQRSNRGFDAAFTLCLPPGPVQHEVLRNLATVEAIASLLSSCNAKS